MLQLVHNMLFTVDSKVKQVLYFTLLHNNLYFDYRQQCDQRREEIMFIQH